MSRLRIGVDVSVLRYGINNGGAVYCYALTRALLTLPEPPELVAFFAARGSPEAEWALRQLVDLGAQVLRGPAPWRWSPDGAWWLPVGVPLGGVLDRVDVFHAGEFHLPRTAPVPVVATVHDITTVTMPEQHNRLNRGLHTRRLRWVRRVPERVLTISDSTVADLTGVLGIPLERIRRIHLARGTGGEQGVGVAKDAAEVRARYGLRDQRYILAVGTIEPRKNHERLLHAFEQLSPRFLDVQLVLAGAAGWHARPILRALDQSSARGRVHRLGKVPAVDLPALYAGATVFAFPSLYEGFGLPILEAMAAGAPVLTSNVSSMPEVAGDAALLVDPGSVEDIRRGLERLLGDDALRHELVRRGIQHERGFTWRRTAEQTLAVYEEVAASAILTHPESADDTARGLAEPPA